MNRRRWLAGMAAAALGGLLAGCDKLTMSPVVQQGLAMAEGLTRRVQRLVVDRKALAKEFSEAEISPDFRGNGSTAPGDADYLALVQSGFEDWRLVIDGLVERPLALSLADLRAQPARTQITRHDCVEGWSAIGKWSGARLGALLDRAGLQPDARFIVFHCADTLDPNAPEGLRRYYESIDLIDAYHPQSILAYDMNGAPLSVKHGAPVRLRVERQLGYKHAKYVMRVEAVADLAGFGGGKGGFWEDRGYEWYAGI